jgi:hypothetical protein
MVFLTSPFCIFVPLYACFWLTLFQATDRKLTRAKPIRTASRLRRKRYSAMRAAVCMAAGSSDDAIFWRSFGDLLMNRVTIVKFGTLVGPGPDAVRRVK